MMQHASLRNGNGEQAAHLEASDLGEKLEQAVHMALNEVVAILGFSLNPDDRAFAAILKAKTTILNSVLNAQVRVDERRFVKEDTEHDRASGETRGRQVAGHQQRHEGATRRPSGNRSGLFEEDHRRPAVRQENRPGKEEDYSPSHLRQDQGPDHRQAKVVSGESRE